MFSLDFLVDHTPLTFVMDEAVLEYIVALDKTNNMWLLKTTCSNDKCNLIYSKMMNIPYTFTEKIYFDYALNELELREKPDAKCFEIYFCTWTSINFIGIFYFILDHGYMGRINTCYNISTPIVVINEPYATRCARLAIDSKNKKVIIGYETNGNNFDGTFFKDPGYQEAKAGNQNIASVSEHVDCRNKNKL